MKDSLGDRMKDYYEDRYRIKLTRRMPVIIRLDGKAFHTLTKKCQKPFDNRFLDTMSETTKVLLNEIQGAKCAYVQSDEISILLTDFDKLTTDGWFDYNIQKIVSVSAGIASAFFTKVYFEQLDGEIAVFDARVFNIPKEEVCNYFIWRQKDWIRNSVQMLAQANFSAKQLHGKKQEDIHEMLHSKGVYWVGLDSSWKNGLFFDMKEDVVKSDVVFTQNREIIEKYLVGEE